MAQAKSNRVAGNIFKGSVGNLIEWYDWYVYSAFAVYFSAEFFPKGDPTSQLLNTAAIFAVGFLMRPIGSLLMGRYADRHGRRAALTLSITVMAGGSLIIACTPSYESIGIMAPIILVLARLLQGLSLGGEYGTSATYLSEMASSGRRGFIQASICNARCWANGCVRRSNCSSAITKRTRYESLGMAYSIHYWSDGRSSCIMASPHDG